MSYPNLNLLLQAANRRELFVNVARVIFLGAAALTVSLLLGLALDAVFAFPTWALIALDASLVSLILLGMTRLFRVLRRGRFDARRVARLLEQRSGLTSNALINAIDLREQPRGSVSRRLIDESLARGEAAARGVDLRQAIESRPARRAAWVAGLAAVGTLLACVLLPGVFARGLPRLLDPTGDHPPFTLVQFDVQVQPQPLYFGSQGAITAQLSGPVVPDQADVVFDDQGQQQRLPMVETDTGYRLDLQRVEQPRSFYLDTPQGRSPWYRIEVQQVPLIEEIWVSYEFPAHTDWAPRRHRLSGREIEALAGTEVTLEAISQFPLAAGNVEIFGDGPTSSREILQLLPDDAEPRHVRGRFRLTESGRLTLRLIGQNQQPGPELREARLVAVDDQPPQVTIVDPEPLALAVEAWKLPLRVEATDDIQVTDLQLNYRRDGASAEPLALETRNSDRRRTQGETTLDLGQLGVRAGDIIRLRATTRDNHPGGGQSGDSPEHLIQVISEDQYLDYLRSSYRMAELSAEISQLRERLGQLSPPRQQALERAQSLQQQRPAAETPGGEEPQPMESLQQELERYAQNLQELRDQLQQRLESPTLYEAEQAYREQLERLSAQLRQQQDRARSLQETLESMSGQAQPEADDLQPFQDAWEQLERESTPFAEPAEAELAEAQEQVEQLMKAEEVLGQAERIQQVIQQQRELGEQLQRLPDPPTPESPAQRQADQLARQQDRLTQQLQEAQQALREAAEAAREVLPRTSGDACQLCDAIDQQGIPADQQQAARAARQGAPQQAAQAARQAADKLESLGQQTPTAPRMGRELGQGDWDRGLRLSPKGIQRTLEQIAQSRSPSSWGQGAQDLPFNAPGTMSRLGLHGPQPPRDVFASRRGGRSRETGGRAGGTADEPFAEAELIEARSRTSETGAGRLRGVPVGYRDQAEAYFRRLAEESSAGLPADSQ